MNNIRMLTLSLMALISTAVLAMGSDKIIIAKKAAPGSITQEFRQVMHPKISLLDKDGNPVIDDKGIISTGRTCGQCHDYQYIHKHNNHITPTVQADCIVCHFKEGRLGAVPSDYNSAHLRIQLPADENCAQCHGLIYTRSNPLSIPPDYEENFLYRDGKKFYDLTQHTGVIMSAQDLSDSALNLKKKAQLHFAWDVHMHRQLNCISCHFIGNDPRFCGNIPYSLDHLTMDPRKVKSPAEILKRPDHNLKFTSCTCCHNPLKVHNNLPNKKRHLDVLSCESCHIPEVYGPTLQTVDRTVTRANGTPRVEYRGVDESQSHGTTLNTKFIQGYRPFLFRHVFKPRTANTGNTNPGNSLLRYKISPFNLVTNWYWKSSTTGEFVPDSFLQKVFQGDSLNGFAADIVTVFDADKNHMLDDNELVLDSQEKIRWVREKLKALGVAEPVIVGEIQAYKINHGVVELLHAKMDCSDCHAPDGKFGQGAMLSGKSPLGITPQFSKNNLPLIDGNIIRDNKGQVFLKRNAHLPGYYILGHSRIDWLSRLGYLIFFLVLFAVIVHAVFRYLSSLKHNSNSVVTKPVYMYRFYERLWHWTMAACIILLAFTGLEIHHTGNFTFFGLEYAAAIHNILAALLIINAFLALFYHLTTGEIRQFFRFNRYFVKEAAAQLFYYLRGIFKGDPHPIPKSMERKLNPIQQVVYTGLLNILLPFQVISGILMWGVDKWPSLSEKLGGLTYLAPVHYLGTWLFLSFLVVHIYLTTTGHNLFSNIRAMITGYDEVEEVDNEQTK